MAFKFLPVSPAHSQKPGPGTQPRDPGQPGSASVPTGGSCQEATVPAWRSTERVCTLPLCKLSIAGSLRLAWSLSQPGAQRGFSLRPTVNFTEWEARVLPGLSKLTDCFCGDNRRIARCNLRAHRHPQHGALSSSGCTCECGPVPQFQARLLRAWEAQQSQQL